ncbi:MAG: hypothetical protein AB4372_06635 [Xenococcus sp. (in: cyanobacteria)]
MTTNASKTQWQYLEKRSSSWRKQLYFKGRRLRPFTVWSTMQIEEITLEEAAYNWDLSLDEVAEAIAYCEANQDVLKLDAASERSYLEERGIDLEPKITS